MPGATVEGIAIPFEAIIVLIMLRSPFRFLASAEWPTLRPAETIVVCL
jgi:hypothetical protein